MPTDPSMVLLAAAKQAGEAIGKVPSVMAVDQMLWQRFHSGAFKEKVLNEARSLLKDAVGKEAVSRDEAYPVLRDALLNANIGQALDTGLNLYRKREYDQIKQAMDTAFDDVRLLETGDAGFRASLHMEQRIQDIRDGKGAVDRLPFGITKVDKRLKGGLGRGELGCILAGQKIGKSMILCWVAQTAIMYGLNLCYITVELPKENVITRIEAGITGMLIDEIEEGGLEVADRLAEKLKPLIKADYVVKQFPGKSLTVDGLRAYLEDLRNIWNWQPDVLIIDYADEMAMPKGERYQGIGDVYSGIRALGNAENFNCAVWTASQIKTSAIDHEYIRLWDAAESYLKGALIDLMLAVCCTEDELHAHSFRLYLASSRYAGGGRGEEDELGSYYLDYEHGRMFAYKGNRFDGLYRTGSRINVEKMFGDSNGGVEQQRCFNRFGASRFDVNSFIDRCKVQRYRKREEKTWQRRSRPT